MSALDQELVPVPLGFCPCEGKPHDDGDVVFLYADMPTPIGVRARSFFVDGMTSKIPKVEVEERIAELWMSFCVAEWTFVFDDGEPIPVTPENIAKALPWGRGGRLVADKADDLYAESVYAPLAEGLAQLSPRGPARSTRRAMSRQTTSPKQPRRRSSTATTAKAHPPA